MIPQVDFGDVKIHLADTSVWRGPISGFMKDEYLLAWDILFGHMLPDQARMRQDKSARTLLGKRWLTTDEDTSWMIEY